MFLQDAFGKIMVLIIIWSSMQTKPPHLHAVTVPFITCVYVSTPVQLVPTKTKNPSQHANLVYQVLTMIKLEEYLANLVYKVRTMMKMEERCAKNARVVDIRIHQRLVKQHQHAKEKDAVQEPFLLKLVLSHHQNVNLAEQERIVMKSEDHHCAKKNVLQVLFLLKLVKQQQQHV